MHILVTGAAGFVGAHVSKRLVEQCHTVVGIDNINDYYDQDLKRARIEHLLPSKGCTFSQIDVSDRPQLSALFEHEKFDRVIHLAAQAGVRYSIENPFAYADSNLAGFLNILEACRQTQIQHLVFASSSSVYGANGQQPFSEHQSTEHQLSLYAATKKSNEMMAHAYAHLYQMPVTGLRFFTVYGPWGRPDMAYFSFTRKILAGETIDIFNNGNHARDFTFIDDIVEGVVRVAERIPKTNAAWNHLQPDPATSAAPYRIYNIGNNQPVELLDFIQTIETILGVKAKKNFLPMQPGDVESTCANIDDLMRDVGFRPNTDIKDGIAQFVDWYRGYYGNRLT